MIERLRPVGERAPLPALWRTGDPRAPSRIQFPGWSTLELASGTAALAAAIGIAIKRRSVRHPNVILPAYSCPDVVTATRFAKAEVFLADTLPHSSWLDPASVLSHVTANTVAVVYPRFMGLAANDLSLRRALSCSDVLLIEDSAHAYPPDGRIESSADLLVFSFGRGKPLPLRSGGALLGRTDGFARDFADFGAVPVADTLRNRLAHWLQCAAYDIGIQPAIYGILTRFLGVRVDVVAWRELRSIERMSQAIRELLPCAIDRLRSQGLERQRLVESLLHGRGPWIDLHTAAATSCLADGVSSVTRPTKLLRYPLLLPSEADRDRLFGTLWDHGLGASRLYRTTLDRLPNVRRFVSNGPVRNASDFAKRLLTLPLHSDMSVAHFEQIANILDGLVAQSRPLAI